VMGFDHRLNQAQAQSGPERLQTISTDFLPPAKK
jgi:hypothetical protein